MTGKGVFAAVLIFPSAQCLAQTPEAAAWDGVSVPITIEVTRDVPVKTSERKSDGSYGQERGTLYSRAEFLISQGERFQMLEIGSEGGCRIEYQGLRYELSSCPWVPGFTDDQADIFVIVGFPNGAD